MSRFTEGKQNQDILLKVLGRFTGMTYDELALVSGIGAGDIILALEVMHKRGEVVRLRDAVGRDEMKREVYRVYLRQHCPEVKARLKASSRAYAQTPRTPEQDAAVRQTWLEE